MLCNVRLRWLYRERNTNQLKQEKQDGIVLIGIAEADVITKSKLLIYPYAPDAYVAMIMSAQRVVLIDRTQNPLQHRVLSLIMDRIFI